MAPAREVLVAAAAEEAAAPPEPVGAAVVDEVVADEVAAGATYSDAFLVPHFSLSAAQRSFPALLPAAAKSQMRKFSKQT